jgi:hypothetical protein
LFEPVVTLKRSLNWQGIMTTSKTFEFRLPLFSLAGDFSYRLDGAVVKAPFFLEDSADMKG